MSIWKRFLACAAALAVLAGCTSATSSSTITVTGSGLTIYASVPSGAGAQEQDIVDAERLALKQAGSDIGKFRISFVQLSQTPSDNARTAIQDTSAIGYLGELDPGASADSLGITNDQDLLQISPSDTAIELTQSTPVVPGAPNNYYEALKTYGRTFVRVVPSAAVEAKVQASQMQLLGVKKLFVSDDGSDYGKAVAYAVAQAAGAAGISASRGAASESAFSASGADALFYGGSVAAGSRAASLFEQVGAADPQAKLFAPSALADGAFASSLPSASKLNLYISEPGFLQQDLSAAAKRQFLAPFEAAYGHTPQPGAIFGYEAMSALLAVLREAGSQANNRSTVVRDFFAIRNRSSVIGSYSMNPNGDTNIAPFVISRLQRGLLVPYKSVTGP